jgi:integrase
VWTPERIRRRETTGVVPSPVVVWTPAETGQFLDHIHGDRLYALFHLVAHCGLRRGEACGLRWIDTDLSLDPDTATTIGTIHVLNQIVQLGWATDQSTPKTDESMATVALDPATTGELLEHRARQDAERRIVISSGDICTETGMVFTDFDGSELHAAAVTSRSRVLHTPGRPTPDSAARSASWRCYHRSGRRRGYDVLPEAAQAEAINIAVPIPRAPRRVR